MWITPNYQDTDFSWPLSLDDKITIFFDRTYGWQLDIADQIINGKKNKDGSIVKEPIPHSGFAVLHIVLSYFEMIAKYQEGFTRRGKSEFYFRQGVYSVFPQLKKESLEIVNSLLDVLYYGARCGLYHGGMTDHRIIITPESVFPMIFDPENLRLKINPHLLVPALKAHLKGYEDQVRDIRNYKIRRNFEKRFDFEQLPYTCIKSESLPDVLKPDLNIVFCVFEKNHSNKNGLFMADYRDMFWSVLFHTGIVPRIMRPSEYKTLLQYGIGLTAINNDPENLRLKIEKYKPKVLAFNGKRPAQEFYNHSVDYGLQPKPVGNSKVFVLPSTSGVAKKYWDQSYWIKLAEFI